MEDYVISFEKLLNHEKVYFNNCLIDCDSQILSDEIRRIIDALKAIEILGKKCLTYNLKMLKHRIVERRSELLSQLGSINKLMDDIHNDLTRIQQPYSDEPLLTSLISTQYISFVNNQRYFTYKEKLLETFEIPLAVSGLSTMLVDRVIITFLKERSKMNTVKGLIEILNTIMTEVLSKVAPLYGIYKTFEGVIIKLRNIDGRETANEFVKFIEGYAESLNLFVVELNQLARQSEIVTIEEMEETFGKVNMNELKEHKKLIIAEFAPDRIEKVLQAELERWKSFLKLCDDNKDIFDK